MDNKIDISVITKPISIQFECPYCDSEVTIDYDDFESEVGECCDWPYSKIKCPECEKVLEIDNIDW